MDGTTALAIYGAVVATGGVAWQVYSWHHARRSHVTVAHAFAMAGYPTGPMDTLAINVTNRSEHPVRVASVGFNLQDGSGRTLAYASPLPGSTLPGVVQPHDSGSAYIELSEVEGHIDPYRPIVSWARLGSGELVESKPIAPLSRD